VTVREMVVKFDKLPDVPVMVTVTDPVEAVLLAASVNMLVLVVPVGLKDAVTPLGRPVADKLTLLLKPPLGETVSVLVPLAPCMKLRLFGDAERVKLPAGFTRRVMVVWRVKLPDVPITDRGSVPIVAVPLAVSVNTLVLAVLVGLKDAVTPLGRPDTDKLRFPVKPFSGVTVIVEEALAPCVIVKLLGEAESEKLGPEAGQLFTRFAALTVPMPVAKSQPVLVP
jgi:hypothetical protein